MKDGGSSPHAVREGDSEGEHGRDGSVSFVRADLSSANSAIYEMSSSFFDLFLG
jgi:hypothetical protein